VQDIFFLTCGVMRSPAFASAPLSWKLLQARGEITLSNTVAVAVRDSGDIVLVDAGWSAETCADPKRVIGRLRARTLGVVVSPGDAIAAQLVRRGLDPRRVTTIVATHFHLDHVGGVSDFPNAEVVTTPRELAAFRRFPRGLGYRAADLAREARVREVALGAGPTYGFAASADVFGDGEVVLLDARGHTAGHLAVAMRTRTECFVHVGDAVYDRWEYALDPPGPSLIARFTAWRRRALVQTYARLRDCEADPRRPTLVPSHDHAAFERLPHGATSP
jgi:glyoxylase-like metal-dependent hydrolase (beta-lactamase superfamily II)